MGSLTEAEWLKCRIPRRMLYFVLHRRRKVRDERIGWNQRKWRLFAASCGRRIWHLLKDRRSCRAIEMAERLADGLATEAEWHKASDEAFDASVKFREADSADYYAASAAFDLVYFEEAFHSAYDGSHKAIAAVPADSKRAERAAQCHLMREIYGPLPFRPVSIDPAWMNGNRSTILRLARLAYEDRDMPEGTLRAAHLSVLADALEDAGCSFQETLSHLRCPGPHVRGCWVIDLLLDRA